MNVSGTFVRHGCIEASLDAMKGDYNWQQAIEFGNCRRMAALGSNASTAPMTFDDIEIVLASCNGANDMEEWIALFRLRDGRYAFLTAGCDFTGWDCQAGGSIVFAGSYLEAIRFALTDDARGRMKILEKTEGA